MAGEIQQVVAKRLSVSVPTEVTGRRGNGFKSMADGKRSLTEIGKSALAKSLKEKR